MKKLLLTTIIALSICKVFAAANPVDSLQSQITPKSSDKFKAETYTKMAMSYMNYAAIQDKELRTEFQENALKYTMSALHSYSRMDDSTGLRISYDRLARIYRDQHKYSQAKWFILQANTMARAQNDLPNITESLITLAGIKMDIKDFDLARRDLLEALEISSANRFGNQQAAVMLAFARYYNSTYRNRQGATALKRYAAIEDSMKRDSEARETAKIITTTTTKKFFTASERLSRSKAAPKSISL